MRQMQRVDEEGSEWGRRRASVAVELHNLIYTLLSDLYLVLLHTIN